MFVWRYLDDAGQDVGSSDRFENQEEAESWLAQEWVGLRDRGVEEVELLNEDQAIYRMGLGPDGD